MLQMFVVSYCFFCGFVVVSAVAEFWSLIFTESIFFRLSVSLLVKLYQITTFVAFVTLHLLTVAADLVVFKT